MTTLTAQLSARSAEAEQEADKAREKSLGEYWRMIARQDAPREGDAEKVIGLLPLAGKTLDDCEADLAGFAQLRKAQVLAKTEADRNRECAEAQAAYAEAAKALPARIKALEDEVQELAKAQSAAEIRMDAARGAARDLPSMIQELVSRGMPETLK